MVKKIIIHGLPDGAGPGDIVGAFANEAGIDGRLIGKIDFFGNRAIVEVHKRIYEEIICIMDGNSIAGHQVQVSREAGIEQVENYVQGFNRLVQLEREEEMERFLHEVKKLTGQERQKRGRALLHLHVVDQGVRINGGYLLRFYSKGEYLQRTQITVGDWVIISCGNPLSGDRRLGQVGEVDAGYLTLFLDTPPEEWLFENSLRLDLYMDDEVFKRIFATLKKLKYPEKISSDLGDIILGFSKPRKTEGEETTSFFDPLLDIHQQEAVNKALMAKDLFLIKGGPGTGKTRVLQEIVKQAKGKGLTILFIVSTDKYVNYLQGHFQRGGLETLVVGYPFQGENTLNSYLQETLQYQESLQLKESTSLPQERGKEIYLLQQQALRRILGEYPVLCSIASYCNCQLTSSSFFDLVLIDDASHLMEPLAIIPLLKAKKVIMAGDHFSLGPPLLNPWAQEEGLEITLFERFLKLYGEDFSYQLITQYRMNKVLGDFIGNTFYQGNLQVADTISNDGWDLKELPGQSPGSMAVNREESLIFFDTSTMRAYERSWCHYQFCENPVEADLVDEIVSSFLQAGLEPDTIGVITPYLEHSHLIQKVLGNTGIMVGLPALFQGQEKDLIIISFVRSNHKGCLGHLTDLKGMNMALSRSRKKTILIGSSQTLVNHPFYQTLRDYVLENGVFYQL